MRLIEGRRGLLHRQVLVWEEGHRGEISVTAAAFEGGQRVDWRVVSRGGQRWRRGCCCCCCCLLLWWCRVGDGLGMRMRLGLRLRRVGRQRVASDVAV